MLQQLMFLHIFVTKLILKENNHVKIGIIVGSTRLGRNAEAIAKWVYELAGKRNDAEFKLVDIKII